MRHRDTRIRDLGLTLRHSRLAGLIHRVRSELRRNRIRMRPKFYLSSEYGTVIDTCNIAIPWFDATDQMPRLAAKLRPHMCSAVMIRRILRHEAGHAFCYGYRLYRLPEFRKLFQVRGNFYDTYPEGEWSPDAADQRELKKGNHINAYALKHPDEDFATCFQTWLQPGLRWWHRYRGLPVIHKLRFVDRMVKRFAHRSPITDAEDLDEPIAEIEETVGAWMDEHGEKGDFSVAYASSEVLALP